MIHLCISQLAQLCYYDKCNYILQLNVTFH
jgi:hypothetical protein